MLETLIVLLLVLWLLGAVVVPVGTAAIHTLLLIVLILVLVRLVR